MADDDRADRIEAIAREMVTKVRDDDPAAVWRWLRSAVADIGSADPIDDWVALAVIQASATPDDRNWDLLVEWIVGPKPQETAAERRRRQWRESQRKARRPQVVDEPVHRLSRELSTVALDSADEQDAA